MAPAATGLGGLITSWAKFYGDRTSVSTAITYLHLAGVLTAGGFAIVADRASLKLAPAGGSEQQRELDNLAAVHRWVLGGLTLIVITGVLMFFSDLHTYLHSAVFWTKMGLVVLLLANGYVRLRAEQRLRSGVSQAWQRFRWTSVASLTLWFGILLAGTILTSS